MSVMKAINGHAVEAFASNIRRLMKERGLNTADFCKLTTGSSNNSAGFYLTMRGERLLSQMVAKRWSSALKVPPEQLLDWNKPVQALRNTQKSEVIFPSSPSAVTVVPRSRPQTAHVNSPFSLVVDPTDRTATVHLELKNIPVEQALDLLQRIGLVELLHAETKPKRISHQPTEKEK